MMKTLTAILASILLTGCASPMPPREYRVKNLKIVCADIEEINRLQSADTAGRATKAVYGCYNPLTHTAYVSWAGRDDYGNPIPCLETLGHEVWHSIVGDFHR
jgi:hypothetical protein